MEPRPKAPFPGPPGAGGKTAGLRILMLNPVDGALDTRRDDLLRSQLSLGSLASALCAPAFVKTLARKLGQPEPAAPFDLGLIHLAPGATEEEMAQRLERAVSRGGPPDLVCATATAAHLGWARRAARLCARLWPRAFRLVGGPHASTAPEDLLGPGLFQAACLGEGVETIVELALSLARGEEAPETRTAGLVRPDRGGRPVRNPGRRPLLELDDYPRPSDSLVPFFLGSRPGSPDRLFGPSDTVYILAGLGCPHNCSFCAQRAIHQGRVRYRSAESLVEEVARLHRLGAMRFALLQETFLADRARVEKFAGLLIQRGLERISWTAEARADQLDARLLEKMKKAGLGMIQLGLESGDQALLDRIGKGLDLARAGRIIDLCRKMEIDTALYLLVGLPGQDWLSILRTAAFLREHPPYNRATGHVSLAVALPYPGTGLAERGGIRIVGPKTPDWPSRTPEMGLDEQGGFVFEEITETGAMTGREISEAFCFLDDMAQFQLAAENGTGRSESYRARAGEYSRRMLRMIVRRALRELVLRSLLPDGEAAGPARKQALARIKEIHGEESDLVRLSAAGRRLTDPLLIDFLTAADRLRWPEPLERLSPEKRPDYFYSLARRWDRAGRPADFCETAGPRGGPAAPGPGAASPTSLDCFAETPKSGAISSKA